MKWNDLAKSLGPTAAMAAALLVMGGTQAAEALNATAPAQPVVVAPAAIEPDPAADGLAVEVEPACDDDAVSSEVSTPAEDAMIAPEDAKTETASCKPCKGRTWCKCTYNGMARASCDPCCYRNNIGVLTCLD